MDPQKNEPIASGLSAQTSSVPMPPHGVQGGATPVGQTQVADPSQAVPDIASDSDLIEKEWVAITKRVIAENGDDPYNLSKALTLLRADYMKKRYGKDIKLPD